MNFLHRVFTFLNLYSAHVLSRFSCLQLVLLGCTPNAICHNHGALLCAVVTDEFHLAHKGEAGFLQSITPSGV